MNAIAQPSAPAAGPQLDNRRVLAGLLDLAIIVAGVFVLAFIFGMVSGGDGPTFGRQMFIVFVAWALYYNFAFESGDGQTPGKKLLKLRVVSADGGPTTTREIAVRTALRVVDGIFVYLVGLIVMLVTGEKRQRLGDLAAGTMVVDAGGEPGPTAVAAPAAVAALAAPTLPEAPFEDSEYPEAQGAPEAPEAESPAPEPVSAGSPAEIGEALPGMSAPEQPDTPEVKEFNPFSEPAQPAEEPQPDALADEPVADEPVVDEPQVEPAAEEPQPEVAPEPAYVPPAYEPEPVAEEPQVEVPSEPPAEEPQVEEAPEPAWGPPSYVPAPAGEAPEEASYDAPAEDEEITLRPMDTVSAIDLVMADDEDESPQDGERPQGA